MLSDCIHVPLLLNDFLLWTQITEADEKVFMFLQDIRVCHISDPKGIILEFEFECNPYFKNTLLTKTYHLQTDGNKVFTRKAIG